MREDDYPLYEFDTKLLKPLLIDCYNLHIHSGPIYDRSAVRHDQFNYTEAPFPDDAEVKLPDEEEQSRITEFFEKHAKTVISAFESIKDRIEDWNWYEEGRYMRFADDYHYMKRLVNAYIDAGSQEDSLFQHTEDIEWLKSRLGVRIEEPVEVNHDSFQVEWQEHITDEKKYYYGLLEVNVLMGSIMEALRRMGFDEWEIRRCGADGCGNIFAPEAKNLSKQRYCSTTCGARMGKRRERSRKAASRTESNQHLT